MGKDHVTELLELARKVEDKDEIDWIWEVEQLRAAAAEIRRLKAELRRLVPGYHD